MILESVVKYRSSSEYAAKETIETFRKEAEEKGYRLKKASYEYKTKKSKGEIIDEAWVVSITQVFNSLWGGEED